MFFSSFRVDKIIRKAIDLLMFTALVSE